MHSVDFWRDSWDEKAHGELRGSINEQRLSTYEILARTSGGKPPARNLLASLLSYIFVPHKAGQSGCNNIDAELEA